MLTELMKSNKNCGTFPVPINNFIPELLNRFWVINQKDW